MNRQPPGCLFYYNPVSLLLLFPNFLYMKKLISVVTALFLALSLIAQSARPIIIETNHSTLLLTVGDNKRLLQTYLGKKLPASTLEQLKGGREAYLTAGMDNQLEPAIRIVHADGNPSLELLYESHAVTDSTNISHTTITLKDPVYPVEVILHYTSYYKEDVIKTWTEIRHHEKKPVLVTQYASSMLHFNADKYWLTQFHGDWAREVNMVEEKLTNGIKIIESKLGSRTNFYNTQTFFISLNDPSTETEGELIAGTLAWTGNFKYLFEVDQRNGLRVISGINPYASEYQLLPGETFTTPEFIFTFSANGKGKASRNLHKWARNYGVLDGNGNRKIGRAHV